MRTPRGVTLWLALWRVAHDLERVARADVAALGLCLSDFAVLEALLHRGPQPVSAIAETVMLTSGSMSTAVDRLEGRGLVRRAQDSRDARVRLVDLTPDGRALIEPAYQAHAATMDASFAALGEAERAELFKTLLALRRDARQKDVSR